MAKETVQQKSMADRLVTALDQDEFVLYSQSIVALFPKDRNSPYQFIECIARRPRFWRVRASLR
jgi:hypothetical protein